MPYSIQSSESFTMILENGSPTIFPKNMFIIALVGETIIIKNCHTGGTLFSIPANEVTEPSGDVEEIAQYLLQNHYCNCAGENGGGGTPTLIPELKAIMIVNQCNENTEEQEITVEITNTGDVTNGIRVIIPYHFSATSTLIADPILGGYNDMGNGVFDFTGAALSNGQTANINILLTGVTACYVRNPAPIVEVQDMTNMETNLTNNIASLKRWVICFAKHANISIALESISSPYVSPRVHLNHIETPRYADGDPNSPNAGNYATYTLDMMNKSGFTLGTGNGSNDSDVVISPNHAPSQIIENQNQQIQYRSLDTAGNQVKTGVWVKYSTAAGEYLASEYSATVITENDRSLTIKAISAIFLGDNADNAELWINGTNQNIDALNNFNTGPLNNNDEVEIRWWESANLASIGEILAPATPYAYRTWTVKVYTEI